MFDQIAKTRAVLLKRAADPKSKMLGLDVELLALADAIDELANRQASLKAAFAVMLKYAQTRPVPSSVSHGVDCECELCALARMVGRSPL